MILSAHIRNFMKTREYIQFIRQLLLQYTEPFIHSFNQSFGLLIISLTNSYDQLPEGYSLDRFIAGQQNALQANSCASMCSIVFVRPRLSPVCEITRLIHRGTEHLMSNFLTEARNVRPGSMLMDNSLP